MPEFFTDLFDNIGSKVVTKTDKDKGAFVPNQEQKIALSAAGYEPGAGGENAIIMILDVPTDQNGLQLNVSYYNSLRTGTKRTPEARIGRDIVHWMEQGDEIAIGNIGKKIFLWKIGLSEIPLNEFGNSIASEADPSAIMAKGRKAKGKPQKQQKIVSDFRRNTAVVAGAISRAEGSCEMPDCGMLLFKRGDGTNFLEVHHIVPLSEGGDDTMINAAALCPMCHRELHYGAERLTKRKALRVTIIKKEG